MAYFFRHITQFGWPIAILLSLLALCLWLPAFIGAQTDRETLTLLSVTLGLTVLNGVLLTLLCYHVSLTRYRIGLPMFLYLLAASSSSATYTCWQGQVLVLALFALLLAIIPMRNNQEAVVPAFLSTLLLCVTSLLIPETVLMIPFLWVVFVAQRALSLRVWLASVVAVALFAVWTAVVVWLFRLPAPYSGWELVGWALSARNGLQWGATGLETLLFIMIAAGVISHLRYDNSHVQNIVMLLFLFLIQALLMYLFSPSGLPFLSVVFLTLSALSTTYFLQRETTLRGVLFLVLCVVLVVVRAVGLSG